MSVVRVRVGEPNKKKSPLTKGAFFVLGLPPRCPLLPVAGIHNMIPPMPALGGEAVSYYRFLDFIASFLDFFTAFRSFGVIVGFFLPSFFVLRSLDMRFVPYWCHA